MTDHNVTSGKAGMGETRALEGMRVIDAGLLVQGPQAALVLADLGADVIKVELPGFGDQARWFPISAEDPRAPFHEACNRGKRSVTIDLRVPEGRDTFLDLADTADVVISNFKPGTLDDWGLGYDVICARNPQVIYATGSTFGPEGPDATLEGADLAGQAAGGLISTTGVDGEEPTPVGVTIADHMASQNMVAGILAALIARTRTGRGQRVDVSLLGGQIFAQAAEYTAYLLSGEITGRSNLGHPLVPAVYGIIPTADGHIAVIGVLPHQRDDFFTVAGCPEVADDERFAMPMFDPGNRRELFAALAERFSAAPTTEWVDRLRAVGIRCAPVNDHEQAAAYPQVTLNGYIRELDHPAGGTARVVGSPIRMSDTPPSPAAAAPELGQHTEEVLLELGYDWDRIAALREAGAI